ncbi:hypothetical protein [Litorisediminicola beolgyonensis]|uniref:Uncharacterized protein n=1 Tax=Litorisediminicola beolgyonensis TaxID=1173614 RepID=A0ABW3ZCQ4_9RHOB
MTFLTRSTALAAVLATLSAPAFAAGDTSSTAEVATDVQINEDGAKVMDGTVAIDRSNAEGDTDAQMDDSAAEDGATTTEIETDVEINGDGEKLMDGTVAVDQSPTADAENCDDTTTGSCDTMAEGGAEKNTASN